MVTSPTRNTRRRAGRVRSALATVRTQLTRQFITRNRRVAAILSVAVIVISVAAVHVSVWFNPARLNARSRQTGIVVTVN